MGREMSPRKKAERLHKKVGTFTPPSECYENGFKREPSTF